MTRLNDWSQRHAAAVRAAMRRGWGGWGEFDCALFSDSCIYAVTGTSLAASFKGRYSDAAGALAVLRAEGYDDLAGLAEAHFPTIHKSAVHIGDLCALRAPETGWALATVVGGGRIGFLTLSGYRTSSMLIAERAFKVG